MKRIEFSFDTHFEQMDTLILPVATDGQLPEKVQHLPNLEALQTLCADLNDSQDFSGKVGKTLLLIKPEGIPVQRLLLVGIGALDSLTTKGYLSALKAAADALDHCGAQSAVNALVWVAPPKIDAPLAWSCMQNAQVFQRHADGGGLSLLDRRFLRRAG